MVKEIKTVMLDQAKVVAKDYFEDSLKAKDKMFINLDMVYLGVLPVTLHKMRNNDTVIIDKFNDLIPGLSIRVSLGKTFNLTVTAGNVKYSSRRYITKGRSKYSGRDEAITFALHEVTHYMEKDLLTTKLGLELYNMVLNLIEVSITLAQQGTAYERIFLSDSKC